MRSVLLALFLAAMTAGSAGAIEPERRDAIVVTGRVWDGFAFQEMFLPSRSSALHLIAGEDSALSFVGTKEYYWPLSRQVYVDFEAKRQDLDGILKISKDGKDIAAIHLSPYVILYPQGAVNGHGELLWGDAALAAYRTYQDDERSFNRRYSGALARQTAYEKRLVEAGTARMKGAPAEVISPPEALPTPSLKLVTAPVRAYRLAVPAGRYDMALYTKERPIEGTARTLNVIDMNGRSVVVADVVPEERWTRPIQSDHPGERIFVRPGSTFYLTLAAADRFQEPDYLSVVSPQTDVVQGRDIVVRRKPADIDVVDVRFGDVEAQASLARFKVEQATGSGFGYRVRSVKSGEKEDLTAFAVTVPSDRDVISGQVSTQTSSASAFTRDIVVVQPRNSGLALGLAFLPLLGWCGVRLRRLGASRSRPAG
ncbi:hypothetical protein JNB71_15235 [Rhizobium herbae]|uniref:Uncharacterized protein n=1 Tax=Rhizobium herbae TaxID=508661 RepID=A0ABS7HC23_9HYPH|nr:hypothetical protein [Rhizobium herbae]MBW9064668.1 hypothetical protein [Rhizobium herbae]